MLFGKTARAFCFGRFKQFWTRMYLVITAHSLIGPSLPMLWASWQRCLWSRALTFGSCCAITTLPRHQDCRSCVEPQAPDAATDYPSPTSGFTTPISLTVRLLRVHDHWFRWLTPLDRHQHGIQHWLAGQERLH